MEQVGQVRELFLCILWRSCRFRMCISMLVVL